MSKKISLKTIIEIVITVLTSIVSILPLNTSDDGKQDSK